MYQLNVQSMEPIVQSTQDKPAKQYTYSEVFNSIQGEGYYTGKWTLWVRFFLCNLVNFSQEQKVNELFL